MKKKQKNYFLYSLIIAFVASLLLSFLNKFSSLMGLFGENKDVPKNENEAKKEGSKKVEELNEKAIEAINEAQKEVALKKSISILDLNPLGKLDEIFNKKEVPLTVGRSDFLYLGNKPFLFEKDAIVISENEKYPSIWKEFLSYIFLLKDNGYAIRFFPLANAKAGILAELRDLLRISGIPYSEYPVMNMSDFTALEANSLAWLKSVLELEQGINKNIGD